MYRIDFYANIPINKNYDIVFNNVLIDIDSIDNLTTFERLLSENHITYYEYDDVFFPSPRGTIQFDLNDNLFALAQLNYIKITPTYKDINEIEKNIEMKQETLTINDGNLLSDKQYQKRNKDLIFYCFIDSYEILNNCVILHYSMDLFHTYTPYMNYFNSALIRSNVINKIVSNLQTLKDIPNYKQTINKLYNTRSCIYRWNFDTNSYETIKANGDDGLNYICIYKLSLYTLTQSGEQSSRKNIIVSEFAEGELNTILTLNNYILSLSNSHQITYNNVQYYYDILDCYVIPSSLVKVLQSAFLSNRSHFTPAIQIPTTSQTTIDLYNVTDALKYLSITQGLTLYTEISFLPTKNILKFGFLTKLFDIPFNSNTNRLYIKFNLDASLYDIALTMQFMDNVIDLTELFNIEMPIKPADASSLAIQKYTRKYNNDTLNLQNAKAIINGIFGAYGSGEQIAGGVASENPSMIMSGSMGLISSFTNMGMNLIQNKFDIDKNNASLYMSSIANSLSESFKLLSLRYSFIIVYVDDSYDLNKEQIKIYNDDFGYEIYYKYCLTQYLRATTSIKYRMNNLSESTTIDALTYFKFANVDLNGLFSNETQQVLKQIFEKGFKIVNDGNYEFFKNAISFATNKIL